MEMNYTCRSHWRSPIGKTVICDHAQALYAETAGTTLPPKPLADWVKAPIPELPPMDVTHWDYSQSMTAHVERYGAPGRPDLSLPVPF